MDERRVNKEKLAEAYWAEAITAVELGLFRFDTSPDVERLHHEYMQIMRLPPLALG